MLSNETKYWSWPPTTDTASVTFASPVGLGGPAAQLFTGHVNSDIEDGKIKPDAPNAQLYNLAKDPYQKQNVIRSHPEIAEQMKAEMERISTHPTAPHTVLGI